MAVLYFPYGHTLLYWIGFWYVHRHAWRFVIPHVGPNALGFLRQFLTHNWRKRYRPLFSRREAPICIIHQRNVLPSWSTSQWHRFAKSLFYVLFHFTTTTSFTCNSASRLHITDSITDPFFQNVTAHTLDHPNNRYRKWISCRGVCVRLHQFSTNFRAGFTPSPPPPNKPFSTGWRGVMWPKLSAWGVLSLDAFATRARH